MTPHTQLIKHNPEKSQYGDCYRTAIACLLDLPPEEVPHFWGDTAGEQSKEASEWLLTKGYNLFIIPFAGELEIVLKSVAYNNKDIYYLISGKGNVTNHVFIALNNKIIHDPSGYNGLPQGPCDDGYYWVEVLIPKQVCLLP